MIGYFFFIKIFIHHNASNKTNITIKTNIICNIRFSLRNGRVRTNPKPAQKLTNKKLTILAKEISAVKISFCPIDLK